MTSSGMRPANLVHTIKIPTDPIGIIAKYDPTAVEDLSETGLGLTMGQNREACIDRTTTWLWDKANSQQLYSTGGSDVTDIRKTGNLICCDNSFTFSSFLFRITLEISLRFDPGPYE